MIRVNRGPEPPALAAARERKLADARAVWARGATPDAQGGYGEAREPLWLAQGRKCAYCERWTGLQGQPVEHFRPRNGADRDGEARDQERYWWLAWTWENLLFACETCNCGTFKGNRFPLGRGAAPLPLPPRTTDGELPPECLDLDAEERLLADPGREDPLDHIRWVPGNPHEDEAVWTWVPRHVGDRGQRTIEVFGLDQALQGLIEHVTHHIRCAVLPPIRDRLRPALAREATVDVQAAWADLRRNLLHPGRPFVAASWCALERLAPAADRARYGLDLPRP